MTFLITGADGQLGRALTTSCAGRGSVIACTRRELDICNARQVDEVVGNARPSVILNCAAYNDVDAAEDEVRMALDVNAMAIRSLARAAASVDATLVHFSTDFVFDGRTEQPYTEADSPAPAGVYAASKLLGEWFAADAPRWFVLRVESLFGVRHSPGARRTGSVDRIIDALEQGAPAKVFVDRVVSPSYLVDVTAAVHHLLDHNASHGLYHVVNSGHCTWYELAAEIARIAGGADQLEPISTTALALKAPRPQFAALSNAKLAATGFAMPAWQDAVARYLAFRGHIAI